MSPLPSPTFTPGPAGPVVLTTDSDGVRMSDCDGTFIARFYEWETAARVKVCLDAYPDLLSALHTTLRALTLCVAFVPSDGDAERDALDAASDARSSARSAIARATGAK